jgi:DNA-binding PadR family transcriptional regulator
MAENRSRYAILGALTLRPMSGYDIRQFFAQSVSHFWAESYGQIYPMLKELHSAGLVSPIKRARESRRIAYQITERGRAALTAWLSEPVDPVPGRTEILLKLFFVRAAPPKTARKLLAHYRERHKELLTRYEAISARLKADYPHNPNLSSWLVTLSFGQHISRALLDWCDEADEALSRRR